MSGPVTGNSPTRSPLEREATPGAVPKRSTQRTVAGNSVQRLDIPDKVFAHPRFIHDSALPGMLHGRVLRSELSAAKLVDMPEHGARAVAGLVAIVRDGNFVGRSQRNRGWRGGRRSASCARARHGLPVKPFPMKSELAEWLKAQPAESTVIDQRTA